MAEGKFVTVINCMDGRTQLPVNDYLRRKYGADYVDTITEPGPIKILAENSDRETVASIRKRVLISADKHGSDVVAVVGHWDCAGNPVDEATQRKQMVKSIELINTWNISAEIIALWVDQNWSVHQA